MGNNLDLRIVTEVHLELSLKSWHLKKCLSKKHTLLETNPKPRIQGCLRKAAVRQ